MVKSSDANGHLLPKQIGCMNGIFHQLFDRRLFFVGRSFGSHHHKRLLAGAQQRLEPHNGTKPVIEKDPDLQKGRTRESLESSQAASSVSSSHSSTLEYTTMKEWKHPFNRGLQSPDLRDAEKDSLYIEARGVTIKSFGNNERIAVMKHINSPRPMQRSKGIKDERVALPRFSFDGRETRDTVKMKMKIKELPRFSLDSKASSLKHSALDSSLNSLCCDLHMGNDHCCRIPPVTKESGSHSRSSSIVTKLMGLDDFPNSITTDESSNTRAASSPKPNPSQRVAFISKSATAAERSQLKQVSSSQQRKTISVRKTTSCSKMPLEPAPWKQQDYSQQSQKIARQSGKGKAPADSSYPSSSVYAQMEKRITELEFKRSGKDLRALKQILKAMQKTREKLENKKRDSDELKLQERTLEDSCSNQNSYQQPAPTIKGTCRPKKLSSCTGITKSTEKVKISCSRTQNSKYGMDTSAHRERANYHTPMNNNMKDPNQRFPSDKKITSRNSESEHSAPQHISVENCTISGRGCGMVSPRMQHTVRKSERESLPSTSTLESDRDIMQLRKKVREKCPENGKHRVKSMHLQLSNDQLSRLSSETRYSSYHGDRASTKSESNNSAASYAETDAISSVDLFSLNSREQDYVPTPKQEMPAVELAVITMEQPSPVSVLDTPFYSEGSPSPVNNISTVFQDESPSPDEAEWNLQNLYHLAACTKSDSSYKNNQKSTAANKNESAYQNPQQSYINKMLLALGLFKDVSIIQMDSHLLSLGNIFNSNTFHTLQEDDDPTKDANEELIKNTDQMKPNHKIQRKIVSDVANEILVHKITSGRLFTMGRRRMSLQGLIKEVYTEMENVCRMPHCNVDDGDDSSIGALNVDIKYESDDWTSYSGEVPALVLDIERLIFKDLINEVNTSEVLGLYL